MEDRDRDAVQRGALSDDRRFPRLERQEELEYRAKLVELALADSSAYDLLDAFADNVGDDASVPHSYANGRVVRELQNRLGPGATSAPGRRRVSVARINAAAADLLKQETKRLERTADGAVK